MFSKLSNPLRKIHPLTFPQSISRCFSESAKKGKAREYVKVTIFVGVGAITCYGTYKYASDTQTRAFADEKFFIHVPWLLKKLNKWFPLDCYTPFSLQKVSQSQDMKVILSDLFTDVDFAKEEGMLRIDGIHIMKQIIQNDIPNDISTRLESGYYLSICIKDFHYPQRESLPGLEKVMSVDEFVAFASDVLSTNSISLEELKSRIDAVLGEMQIKREEKEESSFDITGLNMNMVLPYMREKYGIDDAVVEEYRAKQQALEEKKQRREELEEEKGILEYDINQIYAEIADIKQSGEEDVKERIAELYTQIAEMKTELKRVKNDLYYL